MLRLLAFIVVLGLAAWGLSWLSDNPGTVALTWNGTEYDVSLMVACGLFAAAAIVLMVVLLLLRFILRAPGMLSRSNQARRRDKGYAAISRGIVAVGAGDARAAQRYANEADRWLGSEALTKLLRAQAAQLNGDRGAAVSAFNEMLAHDETRALGLRGLHIEARRAGQAEAALDYARRANERESLPWAAQAVLDDYATRGDWANALTAVESNAEARLIDRPTANRWRAALKTALAQERAERDPKGALALSREALDLAPNLVPAAVVCGKLTAASGDLRRAARILETAYRDTPHPDLAAAYVRLRHGDSVSDRLARARTLARIAPYDPESVLTVARAALEAQDLAAARKALAPMLRGDAQLGRPTARACLLMAEIEEAAGDDGAVREWLNRAARAPRDRAWVADGVIRDTWAAAGPNGAIGAFEWRTPDERYDAAPLTLHHAEPEPEVPPPAPASIPAAPARVMAAAPPPRFTPPATAPTHAPDDPGPIRPAPQPYEAE